MAPVDTDCWDPPLIPIELADDVLVAEDVWEAVVPVTLASFGERDGIDDSVSNEGLYVM